MKTVRTELAFAFLWLWFKTGWRWSVALFGRLLPPDTFGPGADCGEGEPF